MLHRFRFPTLLALAAALIALGIVSSGGGADAAGPPDGNGLDHVIAVQDAHTDRLLAKPGVVGTAVGLNAAGQPVIVIYTESAGVAGLPEKLDGVPVLVEVTGRFFALHHSPDHCDGPPGAPLDPSCDTGGGNTAPEADDQSVTTPEDTNVVITLTGSDADGCDTTSFTFTVTSGPTGGSLSPIGSTICSDPGDGTAALAADVTFDPDPTTTSDSFNFTISDGTDTSNTATVSITVGDGGGYTDCTATGDTTVRCKWPVPIGVSTGHPDITAGTIGARVVDDKGNADPADDTFYALSNNHVYANQNDANIGDPALQPGAFDGGTSPADNIGTLHDYEPILFDGSDNTMDAAIVLSSTDILGNSTPSNGYGTPNSTPVSASLNQAVQKYGRTTSLTTGTVSEINLTVNVCYEGFMVCTKLAKFVDQIAITDGSFSDGGDSGSLIVTNDADNKPVGLLFAGSSTRTIANDIGNVLTKFGVTIDGSAPGPVATGSIAGTVTNFADGTAMGGATVSTDTGQSAVTGADGAYTITDVPTGDRTVTASASGYDSASQVVTVTDGGTATAVDFALATATTASKVIVDSITYATEGGKNQDKHLLVTFTVKDDLGNLVSGASVTNTLTNTTTSDSWGPATGTTGTDGTVTFSLKNAPSGCYMTTVTDVTASGLTWDPNNPANVSDPFCK